MADVENKLKSTSWDYGKAYQLKQLEKYRNRDENHWKIKIEVAFDLVNQYVLPTLKAKLSKDIVIADIGCSIGTFAIEFGKRGYEIYGVDIDPDALEIARQLAIEESITAKFIQGDISDPGLPLPEIDIAICSDIFEHLHDDELGSFLNWVKHRLTPEGALVFQTFPSQYNYIFFNRHFPLWFFLLPFTWLNSEIFTRITKMFAALLDVFLLTTKGVTHRELTKMDGHCNPLTESRLEDIMARAGFDVVLIETANLYSFKPVQRKLFARQPISYRNIYGVVKKTD